MCTSAKKFWHLREVFERRGFFGNDIIIAMWQMTSNDVHLDFMEIDKNFSGTCFMKIKLGQTKQPMNRFKRHKNM